jgi:hypothetical protein
VQSFILQAIDYFQNGPGRNTWLKWMIICGVIALGGALAVVQSTRVYMAIGGLLGGIVGLMVWQRWPTLGLIAAIVGGFFVSFTGPGGVNVTVLGTAGLSALWIFDMVIIRRKITVVDLRTTIPVLALIITSTFSFAIGLLPWYPLAHHAPMTSQAGGLGIFLISGLALLYTANTIREIKWLEIFSWVFVAVGMIYIFMRFIPRLGQMIPLPYQPGVYSNAIFWLWLIVIPFSQALVNKRMPLIARGVLFGLVGLTFYVAFVQTNDWKSGYLPALAGIGTIIVLLLRNKVFFIAPAIPVLAYLVGTEALATDQYSYITRMDAWAVVLRLALANPLFGLGFSNYYWYTHLKPILGYRVSFSSHSQYVDLFAQVGLVGIAAVFWIFWEVWNLGWKLRDQAPDGFAKAYVYGALGGLVGTIFAGVLGDWFLPFVYNVGMIGFRTSVLSWIFLGGMVAIKGMIPPRSDQ